MKRPDNTEMARFQSPGRCLTAVCRARPAKRREKRRRPGTIGERGEGAQRVLTAHRDASRKAIWIYPDALHLGH